MAPDRRTFLKLAGGVWLFPGEPALWWVRRLVRGGGLGRVVFCRASRKTIRWLPWVLDGPAPICEPIDRDELVVCGTEATLVLDGSGYRRFA
jgi:hypothetical protein